MNKLLCLLGVIVVVALVLPYCDGRRPKDVEGTMYPREHGRGHEVSNWKHNPEEGAKEEDKDGHHWEGHNEDGDWEHKDEDKGDGNKEDDKDGDWEGHNKEGHHWDGHHGGHDSKHHWHKHHGHWAKEYHDLNMYFVEASLPPNVYIVLSDKGLEVKALYETSGNTTVITKVGVRVADKDVIVSTNENITIDGVQSTFNETTIELDSGSIKEERGKLIIEYGAYHLFIKMPCPYMAQKYETYVPHIGLRVGVEKSAKVMPAGFVGARISVDPAQRIFSSQQFPFPSHNMFIANPHHTRTFPLLCTIQ